ncbi:MAG: hypothetical protein M3312_03530, partial [Actinomycetota bacterium]|nr:hypothetical protein [Actinomycetota bacterium]
MRRAALTALTIALLAGASAAFAVTEMLKLERHVVSASHVDRVFSPTCGCATSTARLAVTLSEGDTIDAAIVARDGTEVRSLVTGLARPAGVVRFAWDGRDDRRAVVPDGNYRLRIRLHADRRTIELRRRIRVDTRPPAVAVVSARPRVLASRRGGRARVVVAYRTSERSRPLLLV